MTIAEIARLAGVSIGTVDRVLHDRGRTSPATRERILRIIVEHQYRPNAVARQLKLNKQYVIGVLLPELESEGGYWKLMYEGIAKAISELSPFSFNVELCEFNRSLQGSFTAKAKELLQMQVDGFLLAPVLPDETAMVFSQITHIPYVFVDSPLPGLEPLATLAQDPTKSGRVAARIMRLLAPPPAVYVSVQTYDNAFHSNERVRSFHDFMQEDNRIRLIHEKCRDIESPRAVNELVERVVHLHGEVSGYFVANDAVCHLASVLSQRYGTRRPAVIGFDLIGDNRQLLMDGSIDCIISQHPGMQGLEAVNRLFRYLVLHEDDQQVPQIPIDIFFKENLVDTVL
jgi:LacI family transcriptional regulator